MKQRTAVTIWAAVLGAGFAGGAWADEPLRTEQLKKALGDAKISAAQAVAAAEAEVKGGKVFAVQIELIDGKPVWAVELLAADTASTVKIDAVTGAAIKKDASVAPPAVWSFDKDAAGKTPAGWRVAETNGTGQTGSWTVAKDDAAPGKPNVLTLKTGAEDRTFNLLILEETPSTLFKDLDVRMEMRTDAGKVDQGGGLIWRCKDENNYYICRLNPLETNFRVYKVENGKRTQLANEKLESKTGQWYEIRAVMLGNKIKCYVNGKKYLDVTDDTFKDAGLIGLWTKADASSSFDNLEVVRLTKAGDAAQAKAAPVTFDVVLTDAGASKISVIKVVRAAAQLGLKEAKDLVDGAPKVVKAGISKDDAEKLKKELEAAGAKAEVKGHEG